MLLLAAALSIVAVFAAGYAVADHRGGGGSVAAELQLKGTNAAPNATATLEVWQPQSGNWPMTLHVAGLPQHSRYEVYLVRDGRPWGSCGTFRTAGSSGQLTLKLNAPYRLRTGDSWVVTRLAPGGSEPGRTVLRPVSA
jgi:anti-sigma-K factor RskA